MAADGPGRAGFNAPGDTARGGGSHRACDADGIVPPILTVPSRSEEMNALLKPAALVLLVPVAAMVSAFLIRVGFDSEWSQALASEGLSEQERSELTIAVLCRIPEAASEQLCFDYGLLDWITIGAIVSAVLGLLTLAGVAIVAARTGPTREALVRVYRPALYGVVGAAIVLLAIDGLLVMGVLHLGLLLLLDGFFPFLILGIGGAILIGVIGMARSLLAATRRATTKAVGRALDRAEQPALFAFVDGVAADVGIAPPDHVVAALEPNFWVTEADVETPGETLLGQTMVLSIPLFRILTLDEIRSVLGHELAHFAGRDVHWSRRFAPIFRGTVDALLTLRGSSSGISAVAAIPANTVLGYFLTSFAGSVATVSRERELAADSVGARLTSAGVAAASLVKIAAAQRAWEQTVESLVRVVAAKGDPGNAGSRFAAEVVASPPLTSNDLEEFQGPRHPTDSHPPMEERLAAFEVSLAEATGPGLSAEPTADSLLVDAAPLEREITGLLAADLAPHAPLISEALERRQAAAEWLDAREAEAARVAAGAEAGAEARRALDPPTLAVPIVCSSCSQTIYRVAETCWSCGAPVSAGEVRRSGDFVQHPVVQPRSGRPVARRVPYRRKR